MKREIKVSGLIIGLIIFSWILFQTYLNDHIFVVHNDSMENTILSGDVVWVNKNLSSTKKKEKLFQKICIFQPGFRTDHSYYIKRCLGLPGDTLIQFQSGKVDNLRRNLNSFPPHAKQKYLIWFNSLDKIEIPELANKLGLLPINFKVNRYLKCLEVSLTLHQVEILKKNFKALSFSSEYDYIEATSNNSIDTIILLSSQPASNSKVPQFNCPEQDMNFQKETLFEKINQNYYFFVGDNRAISVDSREWGPIPENSLVGSVCLILFSWDRKSKNFRWGRFFRNI